MPTKPETNQSTLKELRAIVPTRKLHISDCYRLAELQAARLGNADNDFTFPSEAVSELPRIQVLYEPKLPSSGMSFWDGTNWIVVLDQTEAPNRQRFSLLHEFKHILDHPYRNRMDLTEAQTERLADYFAACVLMPKNKIKWAWGSGIQQLDQLAARFGVSEQAMRYRLQQVGLTERRQRCTQAFAASITTRSAA